MNTSAITDAISLGALTGLRSMAGPAALAQRRGGSMRGLTAALALGEMIADKTSLVGNRTDAAPLAGRAIIGAVLGGIIIGGSRGNRLLGAALGASAAVIAATLAYRARTRVPLSPSVSGLVEDALVASVVASFAASHRGSF